LNDREPIPSAFERGKEAGETGVVGANPYAEDSPDHHHFETGRKFGARGNRVGPSAYWQRRKN
jgi:hypothetical protein